MFFSKSPALSFLLALARIEDSRGNYTVAGLGERKGGILAATGSKLDLAIAMLETENLGTNYAYGKRPCTPWGCHIGWLV